MNLVLRTKEVSRVSNKFRTVHFIMPKLLAPSTEEVQFCALNRVAIITGAAQGIGFAIVELLATSGAKVTIVDFDKTLGKQAEEKIKHDTSFIKYDFTSWSDQVDLFWQVIETHG